MWWDISKTLSHNCLFNFVVGMRGVGKTYAFKRWAISDFLKTGREFVYVRRYKTEVATEEMKTFFSDVSKEFPDADFEVKKKKFFINGKIAGYYMALSTAKILKSVSYPNVNKICFDEFILDKGVYHYLRDEVTNFLELYSTLSRLRDARALFLSNALTIANPYFEYFNLEIPKSKTGISCKRDILIEIIREEEYTQAAKNTRFGRIIDGTPYGRYNMENEFYRDTKTFIERKSDRCTYYCTVVYLDQHYAVYMDYTRGLCYISRDVDYNHPLVYTLTTDDHKPNAIYAVGIKSSVLQYIYKLYGVGALRFESVPIKSKFTEALKLMK